MAIKFNDHSGGSHGTIISVANSDDGTSGNAVSSIAGNPTYDNTITVPNISPFSMRVPASSVAEQWKWSGESLTSFKAKFMLRYGTLQSADHWIFASAVGGTKNIWLGGITTNKLRLYTVGGTRWTAVNAFTAGSWYRVEVYMGNLSATVGNIKVAIYEDEFTTTAWDSFNSSVENTGTTNVDNITYGKYNAATLSNNYNVAGLAFDNAPGADYVWPYTEPITPGRLDATIHVG
jgi:hypothetical protein